TADCPARSRCQGTIPWSRPRPESGYVGGATSFPPDSRITGRIPGRRGGGGRGRICTASQDHRLGLAVQDADLHVLSGEVESLPGPVGRELAKPAQGLVTVSQALMGQGQEGKPPGVAPVATG